MTEHRELIARIRALKERKNQFHFLELPGQPQGMHMGTSYLVTDLWKAASDAADALEALDRDLINAADALVAAITYDDSGNAGRGGNGGLISRETIRKTDALRIALAQVKPLAG